MNSSFSILQISQHTTSQQIHHKAHTQHNNLLIVYSDDKSKHTQTRETKILAERGRDQSYKIPNKWGWPDSPPPSGDGIGAKKCAFISKVRLPCSHQPSCFLLPPTSSMSFLAMISSFDLQPQSLTPFLINDHPPSSTHDLAIANWSMVSFKPNIGTKCLTLPICELHCTHVASHHASNIPNHRWWPGSPPISE